MQKSNIIKSCLAAFGLVMGAQTNIQAQNFNPIPLTPSSFTYCMVIPINWTYKLNNQSVTVTVDHGPTLQTDTATGFPTYYSVDSGDCLFEKGMCRTNLNFGLPVGGTLLTNASLSATTQLHYYQLPYWTNYNSNCTCIAPYTTNGLPTYNGQPLTGGPYVGQNYNTNINLTLVNTNSYTALSLLCTGGGPFSNTVAISYADGTVQTNVDFAIPNWFVNANTYTYGTGTPTASFAYTAECRCNPSENNNSYNQSPNVTSGSRLWSVDIALNDTTSYPTNLTFGVSYANTGTSAAEMIYAVSGSTNTSDNSQIPNNGPLTGPFAPIVVSGFNAGSVVANSPQTLAGLYPLTATMDNGTNIASGGNTWFEKGWDQAAPTNGFPPHGSTVVSGANPTFVYQMPASYYGPMSVLIDVNHQSNNITPLNTNISYTAFSLLTAGAAIGNGNRMSNYIILEHADGVNESNTFIGYDWFETTVPPAWVGQERCNIGNATSTLSGREVQNLDSGSPKLFDSEFPMQDPTPVTNMIVGYRQAGGATWTTYVVAVSATTNFIVLQTPVSYTPAQNVYAGQTAVFTVTNYVGTLPSYQWQVTDGLTYTNNLNNGATGTGSTISGATTPTLTIANVGAADTNYFYECTLTNMAPSSTSSPLMVLTLRTSTATNIIKPSDPISDFFGGSYTPGEAFPSPAGLTLGNAIDGSDNQYLNWGASGGDTFFQGPVGLILQPSLGPTVVTGARFIVPVNAPICDPADFSVDGSLDGTHWVNFVPDMPLALPNERNLAQFAPVNITNQVLQEVDFPNGTSYNYYRVTFQNVKNNAPGITANSLQIGEIQLLGGVGNVAPEFFIQPNPTTQILRPGGSVTWNVSANGAGPITYQWYVFSSSGTSMIPDATNSIYTLSDVTVGQNNNNYYCVASNPYGSTTSFFVRLIVQTSAISQYSTTVQGDGPIAYFRLDEATNNPPATDNDGVLAYDEIGGHDGYYSNTVLQVAGINARQADNFAAEFGTIIDPDTFANPQPSPLVPQDNLVADIQGISFAAPTNTLTNFSVEAWAYLNSSAQVGGAGLVALGWGHAEQFALDMGGTANAFRFYFRDAGTNSLVVSPNVAPFSNAWYHVVAVMAETNTLVGTNTNTVYAANESLYLNGQLAATTQTIFSNPPGVFNTNGSVTIGARQDSGTTNYDLQFNGSMANVAIYNYALTYTQITNHYAASVQGPGILVQPAPLVQTLQVGGTATWSVVAYGPAPLAYQWYQVTTNGSTVTTNEVLNATGASFTLVNASEPAAYYCTVSNPNGSTNSIFATADVIASSSEYVTTILEDGPIAFLRLNDGPNNPPNDGVLAEDSVGFHNGYYSNAVLQAAGYSATDPLELSAQFGSLQDPLNDNLYQDNLVAGINGINFFTPTNTSTNLSVEAWVYLFNNAISGAGIVSKGYGGGGEEFALDTGGTGEAFRFYFRNAGGASFTVSPNVAPLSANWYHVVGVLNESSNVEYLYTNGVLAATTTLSPAAPQGLLSNDVSPVVIGSRSSASTTNYNLQLDGAVADVSIYNYALSASQVANHYLAIGLAPVFTVTPTNTLVSQGQAAPAVFYSSAYGTSNSISPMEYQWYFGGNPLANGPLPGSPSAVVSGAATPTLSITGFTGGDSGDVFTILVTNLYGSINAQAQLTVASGPPAVEVDLQPTYTAFAGAPFSLVAIFDGTVPFTYQWTYNGAPLSNGGRISGVTSNVLTINPAILGDAGTYQLLVTNGSGNSQSTAATVTVLPSLTFNGSGGGWRFNSNVPASFYGGFISPNTLQLTDGQLSEASSAFYSNRIYCGAFQATFVYQDLGGNGGMTANADGVCFVLQNGPSGSAALGGGGGGFGYTGITPSVAFQINLYPSSTYGGVGVDFATDGVDSETLNTSPVQVDSGNPIDFTITYIGGEITAQMYDTGTQLSYSVSAAANIPSILGTNMAYIGVTGGDGGVTSIQQVSYFNYIPLPDLTVKLSGGNVVLSWPSDTGGYAVQANSNLWSTNNWVTLPNVPAQTNNQNQITVPLSTGPVFYRLQEAVQ